MGWNEKEMTCSEVLSLSPFQNAKCIAGNAGLNRIINHVNVMEVPDVAEWVRPGELLLTTGYPFRDQPMTLMHLIPELHKRGVAALAIKTKRFIQEIPEAAIALANRLQFPIFELPTDTVFSEITRDVMEHLMHQEVEQLSKLQERLQLITNGLLEGGGIEKLLVTLETVLGNPLIWIEDAERWRWRGVSQGTESFMEALASSSGDWLNGVRPAIRRGEVDLVNGYPLRTVWIGGRQVRIHSIFIQLSNRKQAALIAVEWNGPFLPVDLLTIDRVKSIIALEMMNSDALYAIETKYRDPFVQDWLWGRIPSMNDLRFRADACGCPLPEAAKYVVAIVNLDDMHEKISYFLSIEQRKLKPYEPSTLWMVQMDGELTIVMAYSEDEQINREKWGKYLLSWLKEAIAPMAKAVCFGNVVSSAVDLPISFQEAIRVSRLYPVSRFTGEIVTYDRLGMFPILMQLADSPERRRLLKTYVHPLIEADQQSNSQLIQTMKMFFAQNRNVRRTAEQLFTHYNTVLYRMERVQKVLCVDLEQGEHILMLEVALKLYDLDLVNSG